MTIDVGAMTEIETLQKEVEIWKTDSEKLSGEVIAAAQRNLILNTINSELIKGNNNLKAKIKRLEILIANAIPSLRNSMGNPVLSDAQRLMAKEAFDAIFAEQDRWEA